MCICTCLLVSNTCTHTHTRTNAQRNGHAHLLCEPHEGNVASGDDNVVWDGALKVWVQDAWRTLFVEQRKRAVVQVSHSGTVWGPLDVVLDTEFVVVERPDWLNVRLGAVVLHCARVGDIEEVECHEDGHLG